MPLEQGGVLLQGERVDRTEQPQFPFQLAAPARRAGARRKGRTLGVPHRLRFAIEIAPDGFGEALEAKPGFGFVQLDPPGPFPNLGQTALRRAALAAQLVQSFGSHPHGLGLGPASLAQPAQQVVELRLADLDQAGEAFGHPDGLLQQMAAGGGPVPLRHVAPETIFHLIEAACGHGPALLESRGPDLQFPPHGRHLGRLLRQTRASGPLGGRPIGESLRFQLEDGQERRQLSHPGLLAPMAGGELLALGHPDGVFAGRLGQFGVEPLPGVDGDALTGSIGLNRSQCAIVLRPGRFGRPAGLLPDPVGHRGPGRRRGRLPTGFLESGASRPRPAHSQLPQAVGAPVAGAGNYYPLGVGDRQVNGAAPVTVDDNGVGQQLIQQGPDVRQPGPYPATQRRRPGRDRATRIEPRGSRPQAILDASHLGQRNHRAGNGRHLKFVERPTGRVDAVGDHRSQNRPGGRLEGGLEAIFDINELQQRAHHPGDPRQALGAGPGSHVVERLTQGFMARHPAVPVRIGLALLCDRRVELGAGAILRVPGRLLGASQVSGDRVGLGDDPGQALALPASRAMRRSMDSSRDPSRRASSPDRSREV